MKKIINNIMLITFASLLFTACNEDDNTNDSLVDYSKRTVTITSDVNNITIDESAIDSDNPTEITITATINNTSPVALRIPITVSSASSADSNDYSITESEIVIAPLKTSGSTVVTIEKTGDTEGNETLILQANDSANLKVVPFELVVDIENDYINDVLDVTLAWDGSATDGDVTIDSFCDIDFDVVLFSGTGAFLGYVAGSSSCPETGELSGLADGTYYLAADLYDNPYAGLGFTNTIPVTLEYSQEYFSETSGIIPNNSYDLSMTSGTEIIAQIEVVGGYNYIVTSF